MIDPSSDGLAPSAGSLATAALFAAEHENQRWLTAMENDFEASGTRDVIPTSTARIGIEGAGYLVLDNNGAHVFARVVDLHVGSDGRLLDDRGLAVLGYAPGQGQSTPSSPRPLGASTDDAGRVVRCEVDEDGSVWGIVNGSEQRPSAGQRVALGRLVLAIFPSPEHLQSNGNRLLATALSGSPTYLPADAPHLGSVRRNPQLPPPNAVRANLRALWSASGRAEIDVALAASADALERTALNLVR